MRIILSPTKTMRECTELPFEGLPVFSDKTETLLDYLREMSVSELKAMWGCSDKIAEENAERFKSMSLSEELSPALMSFEGLVFKYLEAETLSDREKEYLRRHLRILSGFYGVLKPFDGIREYRLDVENKMSPAGFKDLYEFWGDKIYSQVRDESGLIINLASKEYSKCVEKYLGPEDRLISCSFVEKVKGKLRQKATFAKMARGSMLRYMAENRIETPEGMKNFNALGFGFREDISTDTEYIFEKAAE